MEKGRSLQRSRRDLVEGQNLWRRGRDLEDGAVLYASAHTTPFAETLSALLTSLENASSPCKTHPGVSFSELYQERKVFVTGCLVHIRVLADPDCSSAGSATSLACQEAS